jgi:hypothetical protein
LCTYFWKVADTPWERIFVLNGQGWGGRRKPRSFLGRNNGQFGTSIKDFEGTTQFALAIHSITFGNPNVATTTTFYDRDAGTHAVFVFI